MMSMVRIAPSWGYVITLIEDGLKGTSAEIREASEHVTSQIQSIIDQAGGDESNLDDETRDVLKRLRELSEKARAQIGAKKPKVIVPDTQSNTVKSNPAHSDFIKISEDGAFTARLSWRDVIRVHPAADVFPLMDKEELAELARDIDANGLCNQIKTYHDLNTGEVMVLDGRNRLDAIASLGETLVDDEGKLIYEFRGIVLLGGGLTNTCPEDGAAKFVISQNIARRHLTKEQKADLIVAALKTADHNFATIAKLKTTKRADRKGHRQKDPLRHAALEEGAKQGVSPRTIDSALAKSKNAEKPKEEAVTSWTAPEVSNVASGRLALKDAAEKKAKPTITLSGIVDKKLIEVSYPKPKGKHTFNPTNDAVDWASWTWNPVTGCLHGCKYCYAREMAYRFAETFPIQFAPLFHHERLDAPVNTKPGTGRAQDGRVFVCSMADLFGEWVPQDWIDGVLDATLKAPEWEYLFLTKFPQRYRRINLPPKAWFGASVDIQKRVKITEKAMPELDVAVRWISVEPMLEPIVFNDLSWCDLLVIGAQSETNQPDGFVPAFAPRMEWVIDLIAQARAADVPVYLKPNLLGELTGSKPGMVLLQEHPRRRRS